MSANYPETGLWEVRTEAPNYRQQKIRQPRHDGPELILFFASPIPVYFGLCARSVLNLHDRTQGSQVAARLTVGQPRTQRMLRCEASLGASCVLSPKCLTASGPSRLFGDSPENLIAFFKPRPTNALYGKVRWLFVSPSVVRRCSGRKCNNLRRLLHFPRAFPFRPEPLWHQLKAVENWRFREGKQKQKVEK
jgi:hypothetical protein